jgi:SNF2 family DNA or RNA helicase
VLVPNEDAALVLLPYLKLATPLFKPSKPPGGILVAATWPALVQVSYILGDAWQPGPRLREWATEQCAARMQPPGQLVVKPPLGHVPRSYQVDGARMIGAVGRVLLFDDPGTGKTITTILGLVERERAVFPNPVVPVVCVVPASVVDPWCNEWRAWAPDWRVVAWRGAPAKRHALAGTADVYVVGYATAVNDAGTGGPLTRLAPRSVVVDECHLIKSPHAQRSLAVRRLAKRADTYVALSGTPITHHPGDLWPTLEGLEPLAYPAGERFKDRFCASVPGDYGEQIVGLNRETEPEFRACLLGQHRRVAKADVLAQLPPKVYSVRPVELPPAWRKAYDAMEAQMIAELPDGSELAVMDVLHQLTRLSQLASAAADVAVSVEDTEDGPKEHVHVTLKAPSWKVDALLEVLAERPGSPVVAFAPSKQLVTLAGQLATDAGYSVGYVIGGQSQGDRTQTVENFQAGKFDLLCATTGAGGVGLTLTAASTVAFLQRPWSLVEALQAEDRCHRIGSEIHDSIEIIDIVAANTVDSRVRLVLHEKAGQLAALLQDPRIVSELLGGTRVNKRGTK